MNKLAVALLCMGLGFAWLTIWNYHQRVVVLEHQLRTYCRKAQP